VKASPTFFNRGDASPYFFDIMKARLFTTQSSNVSSLCDTRSDACKQQYHDLIRQFEVLEETTRPSDVPCGFGEDEVTKLCRRFRLLCVLTVNAFLDYVDAGGRRMPADLQPLMNFTHVIPSSTAACERGFSHMTSSLVTHGACFSCLTYRLCYSLNCTVLH